MGRGGLAIQFKTRDKAADEHMGVSTSASPRRWEVLPWLAQALRGCCRSRVRAEFHLHSLLGAAWRRVIGFAECG